MIKDKDGFTLSYKNRWKIQYLKKFNTKIYKMKPELGKNGALQINIGNGRLGKRSDIFGIILHFYGMSENQHFYLQ